MKKQDMVCTISALVAVIGIVSGIAAGISALAVGYSVLTQVFLWGLYIGLGGGIASIIVLSVVSRILEGFQTEEKLKKSIAEIDEMILDMGLKIEIMKSDSSRELGEVKLLPGQTKKIDRIFKRLEEEKSNLAEERSYLECLLKDLQRRKVLKKTI